ncbi:l-ornithine transporter [Moniliophthora roreri MCA 2997]|uniref:L-ornithine transporter n=2 Tax=Moniliophthora roreri TaxID=221103 RepID=V2WY52_MONRO|nr:l-ornithine transporter [Moniliophthora roreri MCA 2997]KAI3604057.1 l-ornithine transporter [Moniliophthora roreri]
MHSDGRLPESVFEDDEPVVMTVKAAVQDVAFGSIAGMVSEGFEYPFDLAKVRLQSQLLSDGQPTFKGPVDCLVKTWNEEGVRGLYRGLPVPLVGSMAETAAVFVAYSYFQNVIRRYNASQGPNLTISQLCLAAAGAGAVTSFILTPIELVKCKLQVQMMNSHTPARVPPIVHVPPKAIAELKVGVNSPSPTFSPLPVPNVQNHPNPSSRPPGPLSIVRNIIQAHGVRGLWLGHTGTVLRETGGTAVWFATKEWFARALRARRPKNTSDTLLPWESALAGAISGAICVAALYPADTVKSAMQTQEELREFRASSVKAAKEWSTSTAGAASGIQKRDYHTRTMWTSTVARASSLPKISVPLPPSSFVQTFTKIYSTHGLNGLYSGCGMTMARAIPSSGIVFLVYDGLTAWFA